MKAMVDPDLCTACGACIDICPEVFQMGEEVAEVQADPVPADQEATAREACEACPVDAISIEE
jgi:ferredoxin